MRRAPVGTLNEQHGLVAVEFDRDLLQRLRPAAAARGTSVPQLCRDLLETVATDKLVGAVLDDGKK